MSSSLPPGEPGRARRRADRPTAARAAGTSIAAAGRVLLLLAGEPARRWRRHQARVELGAAVARHLAGQPTPGSLAPAVAAHRAAQLRLASTEPPARNRPAGRSPADDGSRASRSARQQLDLVAELERLLLIVVQFLPRLAALARLRVAEARLGAWATGLVDLPDPAVAAARERAAATQRHAARVGAELAENRGEAAEAARTALALAAAATARLAVWLGRGLRDGARRLWAWLVALGAAAARATRAGTGAADRGLRAAGRGSHAAAGAAGRRSRAAAGAAGRGSRVAAGAAGRGSRAAAGAAGRGSRVAAGAVGRGSRAAAATGGRGARTGLAGLAAMAGTVVGGVAAFFAAAGRAVLAAANGVAAWIDGLLAGGRSRSRRRAARRIERDRIERDRIAGEPWDVGAPEPGEPPAAARNGRAGGVGAALPGGAQPGRPDDPDAATEPWWLPSHLEEPAGGRRRRGRRVRRPVRQRDPVVAGLAKASGRMARRLGRTVTALAAPPDHRRRGWLPFVRPVAVALALALVVGAAAAVPTGMLVAESVKGAAAGLPDLDELKPLRQPERTQVYDRNGRLIEVLHDEQDRIVVPLAKVSQQLQQAVIAAEDARFYEHGGVDDRGILRAALANVVEGDVAQGGSTITQQLVRNAYPDLRELSLVRKIKEAALAAQLETRFSKQEILEGYLNRIYFGAGYYGVEAASRGYFNRHASEVSLAQAAMLAGVISQPETAHPREHPERAKALRDAVLARMASLGMVPPADADKARQQPVKVEPVHKVGGRYPWFVDGLRRQLEQDHRLGKTRERRVRQLFEGGLRIHTTLDRDLQLAAEQAVRNIRDRLPASGPQVALIAIDPRNGAVRAVVGGNNYKRHKYNVAVQGRGRQPGSSFKPFVLAAALDAGISPDSVWESGAFQSDNVCGAPWKVDNYEGKGRGRIPVREATWRSVNGVYARLMERLCPAKVAEMASRLGVQLDPAHARAPSIALGSAEVRPIEMASAYGTLANMGEYHRPTFVQKVTRHGRTVVEDRAAGERRISAALAWEVNDILKGVISNGTGTAANIGRPQAGKTGTNQSYRDAWFVGYTPQLAAAVWMGDPDQQTPMLNVNGIRVTGGSYPAQVWHDFMMAAMVNQEVLDWPRPPEQLRYTVLPPAGEPKKKRRERKRPGGPGPPGGR
jgi:penicillin-binding protein 1A